MPKPPLPCPKCGNEELEARDCGYSSFNVAWVSCPKCTLKIRVTGDCAMSTWNSWIENPGGELANYIHGQENHRRKIRKEKYIDMREFVIDCLVKPDAPKAP